MYSLTPTDNASGWLLELSGRLLILGWFTLAGVTLGLLCGIAAARSAAGGETLSAMRRAA